MLLIDIGNTRIKWATLDGDVLSKQWASPRTDWTEDGARRIVQTLPRPTRVAISNVGGPEIGAVVSTAVKAIWGIEPRFVQTTAVAAGVRCGYTQPEKLGVDRWLSVIAAHHLFRSHACIVSVGTAMTVDGITRDGQHLGGAIVPGPDMMIGSLMSRTSDIAAHAVGGKQSSALFADNTLAAVYQGAAHALAALIERAVHDMQTMVGERPILVLTGGACERVASELRMRFKVIPELVLQGLAVVSNSGSDVSA